MPAGMSKEQFEAHVKEVAEHFDFVHGKMRTITFDYGKDYFQVKVHLSGKKPGGGRFNKNLIAFCREAFTDEALALVNGRLQDLEILPDYDNRSALNYVYWCQFDVLGGVDGHN